MLDFSKVGLTPLSDTTAFKKIQYFSKVNPQSLYTQPSIEDKYSKLSNLYLKSTNLSSAYNYGTQRQHNYTVAASNQFKQGLLDKKSVNILLDYNYGISNSLSPSFNNEHTELLTSGQANSDINVSTSLTNTSLTSIGSNSLYENPTLSNSPASTTDFKGHTNSLKYAHASRGDSLNSQAALSDLQVINSSNLPQKLEDELPRTFKFKDPKSPNLGFLSSEKNLRLIDEVNPAKFNPSISQEVNNLNDIVSHSIGDTITPSLATIYSSSKND